MAGAPAGNNNAGKAKIWSDAVRKAVLSGKNLDRLANALIEKACEGDTAALKEVGDRLEGKVAQAVNVGGQDGENPIKSESKWIIEIIEPKAK